MTDDESRAGDTDGFASPVPDDADEEQLRRQRGRWRRVLRTALPLQVGIHSFIFTSISME